MDKDSSLEKIIELLEKSNLPKEMIQLVRNAKLSKRARIMIKHILQYGFITTEDLERTYDYKHPPRAARDVREVGIPLETYYVESSSGLQIAAYRFADLDNIQEDRLGGRRIFPKKFKAELYETNKGKCAICSGEFESRYLQIDHRVPYEISGDQKETKRNKKDYMLVCASCNRAKSWSCEHCPNWLKEKEWRICLRCYWGNPANYTHIALREIRRADIIWDEREIQIYERLKKEAQKYGHTVPDHVKKVIEEHLRN